MGILLQMVGGSHLYPTISGPVVFAATAAAVALRPRPWTRWLALVVPGILGIGAIVAGASGDGLVDQLADTGRPGVMIGSLVHVGGLLAAIAGGLKLVSGHDGAPPE